MKLFPAFLKLENTRILVVGGGETAVRKIRLLLKSGADIHVVARTPNAELIQLESENKVTLHKRDFASTDLNETKLVISGTDILDVDEAVSKQAKARDIPVNVPDQQQLSTFVMPSIVDRSPIMVAIGSGGSAPVLVRNIREKLEGMLPTRLGAFARFADSFRDAVKSTRSSGGARRRFWERFFDGPIAEDFLNGREQEAREKTIAALNASEATLVNGVSVTDTMGYVTIVGAGPGDPDLLTFRAAHAMQRADIVLYDNLVSRDVLEHVRRDAERIFVGKSSGNHARSQDEINQMMIEYATSGYHVVRLKGGDPFVFGRGGEELETLRAADIPVRIVPGITAAMGCAASADIPLTHRDHAQAVTFITGHIKEDGLDLDWHRLANAAQTLVVYMGVGTSEKLSHNLIEAGLDGQTPVAIIENGTRPNERRFRTTLVELPDLVTEHAIAPPALIIVGSVVSVSDDHALSKLGQTAAAARQ